MELNIGDKVYKFYNGRYESGIHIVVGVSDTGYDIIPTDCKINGEVPTIENTKPEHFDKEGKAYVVGMCSISIHKATPELQDKVDKYNTRMLLIDKILEQLEIGYSYKDRVIKHLLTRSTKQLFAILLLLFDKADGKRGLCNIDNDGKLNFDFFVEEELVNYVTEPK